ncbi:MAG: hypothetical protein ACK4NR_03580 [Micavibrio sp.]
MTTEIKPLPEKYAQTKAMIDRAMSSGSSSDKYNWSPEKPYVGQGQAIALLVQSEYGGDIVCVDAYAGENWRTKSEYYYNVIDGQELHFCPETLPENPTLQKPRRDPDPLLQLFNSVSNANVLIRQYNKIADKSVAEVKYAPPPKPAWS